MLLLAAMFAAGIAASSELPVVSIPVLIGVCLAFAASAFFSAGSKAGTAMIAAAFLVLGAFVYQAHLRSIGPDRIRSMYDGGLIASGEPVEVTGVVTAGPETAAGGFFIRVRVDSI